MTPPLRWAVAQSRMHWTLAGNLAETQAALEAAAAAGAEGCVCTELALTGFHRRVPELLDAAALAVAQAPHQVVQILTYVQRGTLPG